LDASRSPYLKKERLSTVGSPNPYSIPSSIRSCSRCSCANPNGSNDIRKDGTQVYSIWDEKERGLKLRNNSDTDAGLSVGTKGSNLAVCSCSGKCNPSCKYASSKGTLLSSLRSETYRNGGDEVLEDESHLHGNIDRTHVYEQTVNTKVRPVRGITPVPVCNTDVSVEQGKSPSNAKNLESAGSVLRYALHLRFMCRRERTTGTKGEQMSESCKVPLSRQSRGSDLKGERRFYIYGDLRVVFPQRQSDADEGKV
jgi:hypothetical protein